MGNRRFRVNAPEVVLHPEFGSRSEVKSSGMLQRADAGRPAAACPARSCTLELWGGHPGTANRRVTLNGRTTYPIADHGGLTHCTYQYPRLELKRTDLVNGYNALQFAVDQGQTFWGHMIVDNACLRAILADDHPDLKKHGLAGFTAAVKATRAGRPAAAVVARIAARADWPKSPPSSSRRFTTVTTKTATADARLARLHQGPPAASNGWRHPTSRHSSSTGILRCCPIRPKSPSARSFALKQEPNLCYQTPPLKGVKLPRRAGRSVKLYPAQDMPEPFWSRASRQKTCTIRLDVEPAEIERAELHVIVWDGGAGTSATTSR